LEGVAFSRWAAVCRPLGFPGSGLSGLPDGRIRANPYEDAPTKSPRLWPAGRPSVWLGRASEHPLRN